MLKKIERIGLEVDYQPSNPLSKSDPPVAALDTHSKVLPKGSVHRDGGYQLPCDILAEYDQPLVMRDGATLYADIFRPTGAQKVPALVVYTPYCKREGWWNGHFNSVAFGVDPGTLSGLAPFEAPDPGFWCDQGYAIVYVDAAGTSHSEGDQPFMGTLSGERAYDAIERIAEKDWCTGEIGMSGNSQLGMIQWATAALSPPHLKAIAPWEGLIDQYREVTLRGGIEDQGFNDNAIAPFVFGNTLSENLTANAKRYPLMNAYWEDKRPDLSKIDIPTYAVASWTSPIHGKGTVNAFRGIASRDKWLRVHNTQEWIDIADLDNARDLKRFFDHFLKGIDNGWEATPRVRLATLNPGGTDRVGRAEAAWPLARQEFRKFHLDATAGTLSTVPVAAEGITEYESDDLKSTARFVFEAKREMEITGYINLHLWVEADGADDADLFVALFKEDAMGKRLHHITLPNPEKRKWVEGMEEDGKLPATLSYTGPVGRLRVSHRALDPVASTESEPVLAHREEQRLSPGEIVPVDITLWPTSMVISPGERVVIEIGGHVVGPLAPKSPPLPGSYLSLATRNRGRHRIHAGGKYDSWLNLPIIP